MKLYIETNGLKHCSNICRYYEFYSFKIDNNTALGYLNLGFEYNKNWCSICQQTTLFELLPLSECKRKYGVVWNRMDIFKKSRIVRIEMLLI